MSPPLYELGNARHLAQAVQMRYLASLGLCMFCPDQRATARTYGVHPPQPVQEFDHWTVMRNTFPYHHARLHLLAAPHAHVADPAELSPQAWGELRDVLAWTGKHFELRGYGLAMRCGEMRATGATIAHLHAHLLVAAPGGPSVRFSVGAPV